MVREVRRKQYSSLRAVLGIGGIPGPDSRMPTPLLPSGLYLWGTHNSGKTYIIDKVLKTAGIQHVARVSAVECLGGRRPFMEALIQQLYKSKEEEGQLKCDDLKTFVHQIKSFPAKLETIGRSEFGRILFVVDRAEVLNREDQDLLYVLLNVQDLTEQNICVILCGTLPWASVCRGIQELKPIPIIHFPQYTKTDLVSIISGKPFPGELTKTLEYFVNAAVSVSFGICRDLLKLWRLVHLLHPEFVRCTRYGTEDDMGKLWKRIEPTLRHDLKLVNSNFIPGSLIKESKTSIVKTVEPAYQMPEYSKYVLIAAFLASQNPVSLDKRFFVKDRGSRKRKHMGSVIALQPATLKVPAQFTQARFQSIYSKLIGKQCLMDASMFAQLSSLCNLKLIFRYDDCLDDCKYRCVVDVDLIKQISASINFPLNEYFSLMF